MSLPGRRPITLLALTFATTTIASLALSAGAVAQARKPACSSSASAHRRRGAHACTQVSRKPKAHTHSKVKGHNAKHRAKRTAKKLAHRRTKATKKVRRTAPTSSQTRAKCEDGSLPVRVSTNYFVCGDGSDPTCEGAAYPIVSGNGASLLCNGPQKHASSSTAATAGTPEALCEDGSAPFRSGGSFACANGLEPACEEGFSLVLSSDGTSLECVSEEEEDEEVG
jgi:hypothetical protein